MNITYSRKESKKLNNYETVTVKVGAADNVDFANETAEECYERLREFVITNLHKEFNIITQGAVRDDEVSRKIEKLLSYDVNNKYLIRDLLDTYKADMIKDLTKEQLGFFMKRVDLLLKEHETKQLIKSKSR